MSQLSDSNIESVVAACREGISSIGESLNTCFDSQFRLELGESTLWAELSAPESLEGPGLVVTFTIDELAASCLIPAGLPLPKWYRCPDEGESTRLQNLASEWSTAMLPAEVGPDAFEATPVASLKKAIAEQQPLEWTQVLEFLLFDAESDKEDAEPVDRLYFVWGVGQAAVTSNSLPPENIGDSDDQSEETAARNAEDHSAEDQDSQASESALEEARQRVRRVTNLPVKVIVQLARKKIEMKQLVSLSPGTLITFNKSCEDLLDLYVNNRAYCRGEAVKIGEKFGLKINKIGIQTEEREVRILQ